jgi:hypothetical protein
MMAAGGTTHAAGFQKHSYKLDHCSKSGIYLFTFRAVSIGLGAEPAGLYHFQA